MPDSQNVDDEPIKFYYEYKPYGEFSNFYPAEINIKPYDTLKQSENSKTEKESKSVSRAYPTTEHYFQSMKFHPHHDIMEKVRAAKTPSIAAKIGRDRTLPLRSDWESVKDDIMQVRIL